MGKTGNKTANIVIPNSEFLWKRHNFSSSSHRPEIKQVWTLSYIFTDSVEVLFLVRWHSVSRVSLAARDYLPPAPGFPLKLSKDGRPPGWVDAGIMCVGSVAPYRDTHYTVKVLRCFWNHWLIGVCSGALCLRRFQTPFVNFIEYKATYKYNKLLLFTEFTGGAPKYTRRYRDPAVQQGKPLPDKGVCRHFRQSHRWLR